MGDSRKYRRLPVAIGVLVASAFAETGRLAAAEAAPTCALSVAGRWVGKAEKRAELLRRVREFLQGPAPYPTKGKLATDLEIDPGSVARWSEADLTLEDLAKWRSGAERFKPKTKKARKPGKREAVLRDVRENLAAPEDERPLLPIVALERKHGVNESTILRWLRRDLSAEEARAWRVSSRRRPKRRDYKLDSSLETARRSALVAHVRGLLQGEGYATVDALAGTFDVAVGDVGGWLAQDLEPEELERWDARRRDLAVRASAEVRGERWRREIEALVTSVRNEIAHARNHPEAKLRTNTDLAAVEHVTPRAIWTRLSSALSEEDLRFRARRLQAQGQLNSVAELSAQKEARAELVREHLVGESREIREGHRAAYSTNEALAELFETSATAIDAIVQTMPAAFRVERARLARVQVAVRRNEPYAQKRRRMAERARREMDEFLRGERRGFSTNAEIASGEGLASEWVASAAVGSVLSEEEIAVRAQTLRNDGRPEYRELEDDVVAHVRAQLAVAATDADALMSTTEELAETFGIMTQTVVRYLRRAFTADELAERQARIDIDRLRRAHAQRRRGVQGVPHDGLVYDSMSEAATSVQLAKYVASYVPEEGISLHVPVGRLEYDFRLGPWLVEYHPIVMTYPGGDFRSADEYAAFLAEMEGMTVEERTEHRTRAHAWLDARYRQGRAENPAVRERGFVLVIVSGVNELFQFLARPEVPKRVPLPDLKRFRSEFRKLLKELREARRARQADER